MTTKHDNDGFESQLRAALARREPPGGFAERVLARVDAPASPMIASRPRRRPWTMPVAAAAALLIAFGAIGWQRIEERRRAEEAKSQLMLALRITAEKLEVVETVLDRSTQ